MICLDLQCSYMNTYMDSWFLFLFSHESLGLAKNVWYVGKKKTKKTGSGYESLQQWVNKFGT